MIYLVVAVFLLLGMVGLSAIIRHIGGWARRQTSRRALAGWVLLLTFTFYFAVWSVTVTLVAREWGG